MCYNSPTFHEVSEVGGGPRNCRKGENIEAQVCATVHLKVSAILVLIPALLDDVHPSGKARLKHILAGMAL